MAVLILSIGSLFTFSEKLQNRLVLPMKSYSIAYRFEHWKANIKLIKDYPLIGVGYAQNRKDSLMKDYLVKKHDYLDREISYGHPHNEYLDVAAAAGIPMLMLFLLLLLYPLFITVRNIKNISNDQILLTCSFAFVLTVAFFDKITATLWSPIIILWAFTFVKNIQLKK